MSVSGDSWPCPNLPDVKINRMADLSSFLSDDDDEVLRVERCLRLGGHLASLSVWGVEGKEKNEGIKLL